MSIGPVENLINRWDLSLSDRQDLSVFCNCVVINDIEKKNTISGAFYIYIYI
jgi:hypothetical protein